MANTTDQRVTFTGMENLSRVLRGLPAALRVKILGPAVAKAGRPIRDAVSRLAPKDTGALKRSIIVKTISNKDRGTAAAIIGPDRSYYKGGARVKKGGDNRGANKPANYAHLVEYGHISGASSARFGGFKKGTSVRKRTANASSFVLPQPFMRPGMVAGAPQAERVLAVEITTGIERERARLIASGSHSA